MLRTSANVDKDLLMKLNELSENVEIDVSKLIPKLLLFASKKIESKNGCRSLVQYQERLGLKRNIVNYYLSEDENEILSEVRQKYKVSISLLLFVAFMLLWEQFVEYLFKRLKEIGKIITNIAKKHNSYVAVRHDLSRKVLICARKLCFRFDYSK